MLALFFTKSGKGRSRILKKLKSYFYFTIKGLLSNLSKNR